MCFLDKAGGEGALELMIECMMEVFNVLTSQNHEGHSSIPCAKRRRLSEAVLSKSPCQVRQKWESGKEKRGRIIMIMLMIIFSIDPISDRISHNLNPY